MNSERAAVSWSANVAVRITSENRSAVDSGGGLWVAVMASLRALGVDRHLDPAVIGRARQSMYSSPYIASSLT